MKHLKIKESYLLFLIVIGLVSLSLYTTYALFTASTTINDVVSFSTSLTTDSSVLEYEMVTIPAGESKIIELNVTNSHTSTIYYGAWYQAITDISNINIGVYTEENNTPASGTIAANGSATIIIGISNDGTSDVILNIGVVGSETSNLNLASNRTLITGEFATDIVVTDEYLQENTIIPKETINLEYSTANKTQVSLYPGEYKLEVWGAQGGYRGSSYGVGGKGGYSYGTLTLTENTTLYVYVGGKGGYVTSSGSAYYADGASNTSGGFNGGANATYYGGGGGGASDIRIGTDSLHARVIVAGGGGGAQGRASSSYLANGGYGGGTSGGDGSYNNGNTSTTYTGKGATQTAGGAAGSYSSYPASAGTFGAGGVAGRYSSTSYYGSGAGGGGWYGGGGGAYRYAGGGGGSGYVYTSSTASNYPSGCLLNSSYYLTDAATIGGNKSFKDFSGSTVTGHSGNGAARISGVQKGLYTIPVIFGLTDMTIELGTNISLSNNVTYICENGGESCEYVGPDNIDTSTLSEGTYQINYRIVDSNNTTYIYQRTLNVINTTGTLVSNEYLNEHSTSTTTPGTEQITPINYTESGSYTVSLTSGVYTLEVWGAQGGAGERDGYGGTGGYATGTLTLNNTTTLYVYVGGEGGDAYDCADTDYGSRSSSGGFNGGGNSISYCTKNSGAAQSLEGAGGGGSDIRIGTDSLYARVIVAGGGGGAREAFPGGKGGGTTGEDGKLESDDASSISTAPNAGKGGTQTAGGASYFGSRVDSTGEYGDLSGFGVGASANSSKSSSIAGGGGGWYGGGYGHEGTGSAGGGSGYVYTSSTASNYPSGCLLNSSYYLTNTSMSVGGNYGDGEAKISGIKNIQITTITYHIPRVLNLTNVSITKGQTYDLTTGVTYECENGTTSCTYLGPSITDTSILDTGTHKIKYSIKSADNTVYIYERTLTVN